MNMRCDPAYISRSSSVGLPEQLRDVLKLEILGGSLSPGTRLPSEAQLMGGFSVSRVTVRRAIALLNEALLTESITGLGTFVTLPKSSLNLGPTCVMRQMRELGHRPGDDEGSRREGVHVERVLRQGALALPRLEGPHAAEEGVARVGSLGRDERGNGRNARSRS